jgi:CIC family chloride channel protein
MARDFYGLAYNRHVGPVVLAVVIGFATGLAAIGFRELISFFNFILLERALVWAEATLPYGRAALPVITGAGGLAVGLLVHYLAPEAKGSGIPDVMGAVAVRGGIIRRRVAPVKALAAAICMGSGGSAGREGPIVQIGSSIGSALSQVLHLSAQRTKTLVGCGAAAGIAATFNAPVAGALFSLEVILGDFGFGSFAPVVISSVVGAAVGRWYFGNHPSLTVLHFQLRHWGEFPLYAVLGVAAGILGVVFTKLLYGEEDFFGKVLRVIPAPARPMLGGVAVGTLGIFLPQILGTGYGPVDAAVSNIYPLQLVLIFLVAKLFATTTTLGSGGSGGIFAPALFMGAMLGGAFGMLARLVFPGLTAQPGVRLGRYGGHGGQHDVRTAGRGRHPVRNDRQLLHHTSVDDGLRDRARGGAAFESSFDIHDEVASGRHQPARRPGRRRIEIHRGPRRNAVELRDHIRRYAV